MREDLGEEGGRLEWRGGRISCYSSSDTLACITRYGGWGIIGEEGGRLEWRGGRISCYSSSDTLACVTRYGGGGYRGGGGEVGVEGRKDLMLLQQ